MSIILRPGKDQRNTEAMLNTVLRNGETAYELADDGIGSGLIKSKTGDGKTPYKDLPYLILSEHQTEFFRPKKSSATDYTYEILYKSLNYQDGLNWFESDAANAVVGGGCSSLRVGNYYGRNFDFEYNNAVSFEITTEPSNEFYKVRGFCGKLGGLEKDVVESGKQSDLYKVLPFYLIDGCNEKGLACNINVVHASKYPQETKPGAPRVCALMAVSWVLHRCANVHEALEEFKRISIYPSKAFIQKYGYEVHFMLNDATNCYVVEFENNKMYFINMMTGKYTTVINGIESEEEIEIENLAGNCCMTNFRIKNIVIKSDNTIDKDAVAVNEPFAIGLERWNILANADSSLTMMNKMKLAKQNNAYTFDTDPFWVSEFAGEYPNGTVIKCNSSADDPDVLAVLTEIINYSAEIIENHDRNAELKPWQTVYTQVWSLADYSLDYCCQSFEDDYDTVVHRTFNEESSGGGSAASDITYSGTVSGLAATNVQNAIDESHSNISNKMNSSNPTGTGSLSLNRNSTSTVGTNSVAVGESTKATASRAFAEGWQTTASGNASHAEGYESEASGEYAHAEGNSTTASGANSHAEGVSTKALAQDSHAEGYNTTANYEYSHAEGNGTTTTGSAAHAEGKSSSASGSASHAEGESTEASGQWSHAEGYNTTASQSATHAEGYGSEASAQYAHAEGNGTTASGANAHAEGQSTTASNTAAHAEGNATTASGMFAHAEGSQTTAVGQFAHAEGDNTSVYATGGHAEGHNTSVGTSTNAGAVYAHVEGNETKALNVFAHAEGNGTTASGPMSHAEGLQTTASGEQSHAEGNSTTASYSSAHAEGYQTVASGYASHTEGFTSHASGQFGHAEGYDSSASGYASHAEGGGTIAASEFQHAGGKYNIEDTDKEFAFIIGNGYIDTETEEAVRSNAFTVDWNGNGQFAGNVNATNIPEVPDTDGVYVLTCTISSGVPTYEWVAQQ